MKKKIKRVKVKRGGRMGLVPSRLGGINTTDFLIAGVLKYFAEKTLTPVIGNGSIVSGAVKIGGSLITGRMYKPLSLALAIDGVEDIIVSLVGNSSAMGGNEFSGGVL